MSISDKNFLADVTSFAKHSKHFIFTYKLCHDDMIYSQKFQLFIVRQVDAMQIVSKHNCITKISRKINFCLALFILN